MNNPGIDVATWNELRKKWSDLNAQGHKLKISFKLITDSKDKSKVLAIDVIQNIDEELITETVQRIGDEAYETLGIAGLSMERLIEVYKEMMEKLYRQTQLRDADLIVTMSPSSPTAGEVRGYVGKQDSNVQNSVLVNYRHYYMLNALRGKMIESVGDAWSKVRAVYHSGNLEFYFEY